MSATTRQHTLFPLPPAQLIAGRTQSELAELRLPPPKPTPALLTTNPALAQARGEVPEETARATTDNARRLFGTHPPAAG